MEETVAKIKTLSDKMGNWDAFPRVQHIFSDSIYA
jgi:hypothetical protein